MKRVTKRTLSLVERQTGQQLDRQAARNWVLINLHGGAL
jgi:creatinine amidohydrolase/Fe(II)-dependent formamide hydrolase-like protein